MTNPTPVMVITLTKEKMIFSFLTEQYKSTKVGPRKRLVAGWAQFPELLGHGGCSLCVAMDVLPGI